LILEFTLLSFKVILDGTELLEVLLLGGLGLVEFLNLCIGLLSINSLELGNGVKG